MLYIKKIEISCTFNTHIHPKNFFIKYNCVNIERTIIIIRRSFYSFKLHSFMSYHCMNYCVINCLKSAWEILCKDFTIFILFSLLLSDAIVAWPVSITNDVARNCETLQPHTYFLEPTCSQIIICVEKIWRISK